MHNRMKHCSKCGTLRQIGTTDQNAQSFKLKTCDTCRKRNLKYKHTHSVKRRIEPTFDFESFLQQISKGTKATKIIVTVPDFIVLNVEKVQESLKVHYINRVLAVLEGAGSRFSVRSSNTKNSHFYAQYQCQNDSRSPSREGNVKCDSKLNLSYDLQSREMCIEYSHSNHAVPTVTPFSLALGNAYNGGVNSGCI